METWSVKYFGKLTFKENIIMEDQWRIAKYNSEWKTSFLTLCSQLRNVLGEAAVVLIMLVQLRQKEWMQNL